MHHWPPMPALRRIHCLKCGSRALSLSSRNGIMAAKPGDADVVTWKHPGGEPTLDHVESLLFAWLSGLLFAGLRPAVAGLGKAG